MTPDAYYRVPAFKAKGVRVERGGRLGLTVSFPEIEEGAADHGLAVFFGAVVSVIGAITLPGLTGLVFTLGGAFVAGWAANNALIAYRCERVEADDA